MAFDNDNFRQAWSAETTIAFLRRLNIANRMNATWDGDAQTNRQVFIQNPNYNATVTNPARKADWGTPVEPSAEKLTITMDQRARAEYMLYVEDQVENAVMDYRSRLQTANINAMAVEYEDNLVTYMNALEGAAAPNYAKVAANGGAGQIASLTVTTGANGFSHDTGKEGGAAGVASKAILGFFDDCRVILERQEIHLDGMNMTIGGMMGQPFVVVPIELFIYGLAAALEAKGIDLPFMNQLLRNLGIFTGTALAGHYRGFDIFVSNALKRPADTTANGAANLWRVYAGSDRAVAAPRRRVNNYVTRPENASAERYEFRHTNTWGRQLANSRLLIRGTVIST